MNTRKGRRGLFEALDRATTLEQHINAQLREEQRLREGVQALANLMKTQEKLRKGEKCEK